jgi:hypothetical protein
VYDFDPLPYTSTLDELNEMRRYRSVHGVTKAQIGLGLINTSGAAMGTTGSAIGDAAMLQSGQLPDAFKN